MKEGLGWTSQMNGLVTFDFDDTLTVPIKDKAGFWHSGGYQPNHEVIGMLLEKSTAGHPIAIVTSRPFTQTSKEKIRAFAQEHELPVQEIVFTNLEWKADTLERMRSVLHYDDNPDELERIREKGIEVIEIPHPPGLKR
jgi:hypothetical protein